MIQSDTLSTLISTIADAGRELLNRQGGKETHYADKPIIECCEDLLSSIGEATGLAVAREVLDRFAALAPDEKLEFFSRLDVEFGVDVEKLNSAVEKWRATGNDESARALHFASEPRSQEIVRRLNRAPGGTASLVAMRAELLTCMRQNPDLRPLDDDFRHLFGSWFNRGFLELRQIDWATPAEILEKVIAYEAVHEINGWDDLRRRVAAPDRYLFGFFHPALKAEPLIFVEVALTDTVPGAIQSILAEDRAPIDPSSATTAVFYSISNCQVGLKGVSFGNFLIKQVVEELRRNFRNLETFVTLSPVPGFRRWAEAEVESESPVLDAEDRAFVERLRAQPTSDPPDIEGVGTETLRSIAARYLVEAKSPRGGAVDPVARFHLGNGARLENVHSGADLGARGWKNSWGVMVNYLYRVEDIERNHEIYASRGETVCSATVARLLKNR